MGSSYAYVCVKRIHNQAYIQIRQGKFKQEEDVILFEQPYGKTEIEFFMEYIGPESYRLGYNEEVYHEVFTATPGRWIGGKYGIYAKGKESEGMATFKYFRVDEIK